MNRTLLLKNIRESKWLLLACAAAIFSFCWVRVWLVSRLDTDQFRTILEMLPSDWKKFVPIDMEFMITFPGRISLVYNEPIVVFGVTIWAIARGSDCVSGELNRGTLEMLLAQPLSRLQVLVSQSLVTVVGVGLLAATAWLGTWVGVQTNYAKETIRPAWSLPIPLPWIGSQIPKPGAKPETRRVPMSTKVDAAVFVPATANLFSLGFFLAGLTTLVSASDRYRWRTIGIVVGIYIVQTIFKIIALADVGFEWLRFGTVLTAYNPEKFVQIAVQTPELTWSLSRYDAAGRFVELGPLGYDLVLIGLGGIAFAAAARIFCRRDLPAPL